MNNTKLLVTTLISFILITIAVNILVINKFGTHDNEKLKLVNHTYELIIETEYFLNAVKDMETGQRGYLLTKNSDYLEPYNIGSKNAKESLQKLKILTANEPAQLELLEATEHFLKLKVDELQRTILFTKNKNYDAALSLVKQNIGKAYMHRVRDLLDQFISKENNTLHLKKLDLEESNQNTLYILRISFFVFLTIIFFFLYRSLTQNKLLQIANTKAQEAVVTKSEFLANMSHEIRTPLNAIVGFIDLLKAEVKGTKALEYLNIVDKSSNSLLHIIDDILDFTKIESGKLEIDMINFDPRLDFGICTHLFDAKCSKKNITLSLNIDQNIPHYLYTDAFRIKQILSNLLSNAVKFTPNGGSITTSIDFIDEKLYVSVKDTGVGIADNKIDHIINSFSQEDSSTTRNYGGSGLGLSISKSLVELLGGKLSINSELGSGSEFSFYVPAQIAQDVSLELEEVEEENTLSGIVLLVEDNKTNQMLMEIILDELGFDFHIANDGLEAIEHFKNNVYDVILMDENMPNMGGIEATSHIRELEEKEQRKLTPIIALTANALKGDREKFLNAGMNEYQAKPLDKKKLQTVIQKVL